MKLNHQSRWSWRATTPPPPPRYSPATAAVLAKADAMIDELARRRAMQELMREMSKLREHLE